MADVAFRASTSSAIDDFLDYLMNEWGSIPALADEWHEWDEHSRLVFEIDWGVPEDRLDSLERWASEGVLSPGQRRRYDELLALVAAHRPTLDRLFAE